MRQASEKSSKEEITKEPGFNVKEKFKEEFNLKKIDTVKRSTDGTRGL